MKKKIFIPLATIAFLLIGIRVGTTSAYFISEDKITNNFQNGDVNIEVEEPNFDPPKDGWSGQKVDKKVQVKNESTVPVLVRASITPSWSNDKDGNEPFLGDISDNVIKLNFNKENLITDSNKIVPKSWIKGNDGYYYYTSALGVEGDNKETMSLLESVEATINEDIASIYEDKYLQVDVKSEAIQISKNSYKNIWNITDKVIVDMLDKIVSESKEN